MLSKRLSNVAEPTTQEEHRRCRRRRRRTSGPPFKRWLPLPSRAFRLNQLAYDLEFWSFLKYWRRSGICGGVLRTRGTGMRGMCTWRFREFGGAPFAKCLYPLCAKMGSCFSVMLSFAKPFYPFILLTLHFHRKYYPFTGTFLKHFKGGL